MVLSKFVRPMIALLAVVSVAVAAEKEINSGLPVGEKVPAFNVRDITGPSKGKTLCYRCQYGNRPVVTIFTRSLNDNVSSLIKQVDDVVGSKKDDGMRAFVVFISDDADTLEPKLASLAKDKKIANTPLTIVEGEQGPPNYKLAKDADVTVMMWVEGQVKVNHSFAAGALKADDVKKVVGETAKILN